MGRQSFFIQSDYKQSPFRVIFLIIIRPLFARIYPNAGYPGFCFKFWLVCQASWGIGNKFL